VGTQDSKIKNWFERVAKKKMDERFDDIIHNFKISAANIQSQLLVKINEDRRLNKGEWPTFLIYTLIQLSKNAQQVTWLIQWQPKVLEHYFPTLKALLFFNRKLFQVPDAVFCRDRNEDTEPFLFRAFIHCQNYKATYFFMCRGFSVAGTDDQYYHWTVRLEAKARCYRAMLTVLGIARFRRREQRDTLGLVAKALWSTRVNQEEWWKNK
jgi:hypothetical protein